MKKKKKINKNYDRQLQTIVFLPAATPHLIEDITIGNEKKHPK